MGGHVVSAKGTGLKRCKPRPGALERHIRGGLALKHLSHKHQPAVLIAIPRAIANHPLAERCSKLRRKIAHLIGMRQQHEIGLRLLDNLCQRE